MTCFGLAYKHWWYWCFGRRKNSLERLEIRDARLKRPEAHLCSSTRHILNTCTDHIIHPSQCIAKIRLLHYQWKCSALSPGKNIRIQSYTHKHMYVVWNCSYYWYERPFQVRWSCSTMTWLLDQLQITAIIPFRKTDGSLQDILWIPQPVLQAPMQQERDDCQWMWVIACQCPNTLRLEAVKSNCHKHQTQPPKFQVHPRIEGYQDKSQWPNSIKFPQSSVAKAFSFRAKRLGKSQQYFLYIPCCWQAFIYLWVQLLFVAFSFGISGPNGTSELAKQLWPEIEAHVSSRVESSLGIRRKRCLEGLPQKSTRDNWHT